MPNNRKETNKRGVNPRGFLIQRIPVQVLAAGVYNGKPVTVAVKSTSLRKVYHYRGGNSTNYAIKPTL